MTPYGFRKGNFTYGKFLSKSGCNVYGKCCAIGHKSILNRNIKRRTRHKEHSRARWLSKEIIQKELENFKYA